MLVLESTAVDYVVEGGISITMFSPCCCNSPNQCVCLQVNGCSAFVLKISFIFTRAERQQQQQKSIGECQLLGWKSTKDLANGHRDNKDNNKDENSSADDSREYENVDAKDNHCGDRLEVGQADMNGLTPQCDGVKSLCTN